MFNDTYKTILGSSEGLFKDKGSKFLAFAYPVTTEEEVNQAVQKLRKEYHDARHHCYAYRLGADMQRFRMNDDGEPSSTAGKPIFGQIKSKELTNILIVVVRYFGGTLLGVSGLINAYKSAATLALESAEIIEKTVNDVVEVSFEYLVMNDIMKVIKDENLDQISQQFDTRCLITLSIRQAQTEQVIKRFSKVEGAKASIIGIM